MDVLSVNLAGVVIIAFIVWWFWLSSPTAQRAVSNVIDILVDNGTYTPARIEVEAGKKVTLRFTRKDASPCAERVIFEQFGVNEELAINDVTEIEVTANEPGEYVFTCQMHMYTGSLVAR